MKKSIALFSAVLSVVLASVTAGAAEQKQKSEPTLLPASEYRTPLQEVIVEGKAPYWQSEAAPRWDRAKTEAPKIDQPATGRLQLAPRYLREERDDYNEPRDQLNPKARTKLFELKF